MIFLLISGKEIFYPFFFALIAKNSEALSRCPEQNKKAVLRFCLIFLSVSSRFYCELLAKIFLHFFKMCCDGCLVGIVVCYYSAFPVLLYCSANCVDTHVSELSLVYTALKLQRSVHVNQHDVMKSNSTCDCQQT